MEIKFPLEKKKKSIHRTLQISFLIIDNKIIHKYRLVKVKSFISDKNIG